jgi:Domain of unknown function (DUF4126)
MTFWDSITGAALSLVVSGNTGVSPFLSLFIVAICGHADPTLLNTMDSTISTILSSWPALIVLAILALLEFVAKCVPVIDAIVDSALVFVVPLVSIVGSLSTFGVLTTVSNGVASLSNNNNSDGSGGRALQYDAESSGGGGAGPFLVFLQVVLVITGICLSILIHLFKMIIRLLGEGCCTNCLTILETSWIVSTIIMAIYIRPIAIGVAIILLCSAAYSFKRRVLDKLLKKEEGEEAANSKPADGSVVPPTTMENTSKEKRTAQAEPKNDYVAMKQV